MGCPDWKSCASVNDFALVLHPDSLHSDQKSLIIPCQYSSVYIRPICYVFSYYKNDIIASVSRTLFVVFMNITLNFMILFNFICISNVVFCKVGVFTHSYTARFDALNPVTVQSHIIGCSLHLCPLVRMSPSCSYTILWANEKVT